MQSDYHTLSLDQLATDFEGAASDHGQAVRRGDSPGANQAHRVLVLVAREMLLRGDDGRQAFIELLANPDPAVRGWAAAEALFFAPGPAAATLQALAAGPPSPERLTAEYTLKEWHAGRLKAPSAINERAT